MLFKLLLIPLISLFLVPIVQSQREMACDLNCHFAEPYISSETLKKWPKTCKYLCGNLIFNEETDLTDYELSVNFWKLEELKGFLRIQNSTLTSLNFLENLRARQCEGGEFGEFVVSNNLYLTNLGNVKNFANGDKCTWRIVKNPKLDISSYEFLAYLRLENFGNLKDYECVNVRITPESLPYYSNCLSINNGAEEKALKISNLSSLMDLSGFLKLKSVVGGIEISNTDLEDLSFLKNLKIIEMPGGPMDRATIEIQNNPNLKRLGWDFITVLPKNGKLLLKITKNHAEFCLSIEEVQKFAKVAPWFFNEDKILFCANLTRADGQKVCKFEGFGSFETDCYHVVGDVIVDEDNEKDVWMLENVTHIYGSLIIRDTRELVNLDFLASLKSVMRLKKDEDQIIRILSNKKLEKVIFPKMTTPPFPIGEGDFIDIDGNSLEIFKIQRDCILIRAMTKADVKYNGKGCCEYGDFVVSNNPYLTDIERLQNFYNGDECTWRFVNNSQLDLSSYGFMANVNLENYGNLKDSGCASVRITPESLPYYSNCTSITGNYEGALRIYRMSSSMDLTGFLNLKSVVGGIEIRDTDLVDLSFLKNLKNLKSPGMAVGQTTISIQNNPNLKGLGWDSITVLPKGNLLFLNITNNHPEFCLTIDEVQKFAQVDATFFNEDKILLCPNLTRADDQKVCKFDGFESFETNCRHVVGDVIVDEDNEKDVWMLENVTYIYGSLIIRDTRELVNLNFLASLRMVMRLTKDEDQIIRILSNKKLEKVIFPKMKSRPFPMRVDDFIDIDGNSLEIFKVQKECLLIRAMTKAKVKYNSKSCTKLPRAGETSISLDIKLSMVWIFILLLVHF
ncbi:hypothetical protein B9Z55_017896 [Caenorhabditis nigoni]|uniref:Receptor L-domain domain-containing protein n=2 Tax=Caenorhabditis nigoni TaxID=1611254 RepID=A0A2G5TC59_9PELO|nr:hypothetical protein B9Z55_017896 [Caenorhabditis nigoni]